jgi:hypothetical protein
MQAMPRPAQRIPGTLLPFAGSAVVAAISAARGIGQGAATPAPQPISSPQGTVIGRLIPNGSPDTL